MEELRFAKPKKGTKHRKKSIHDFSKEIKRKEYEEAKGICRICHSRPITQYHHANEKGMGGGRGLGIQINCIGLCDTCHNHDNTDVIQQTKEILRQRIEKLFTDEITNVFKISKKLNIDSDIIIKQMSKGFLKYESGNHTLWIMSARKENIKRWLGVSA